MLLFLLLFLLVVVVVVSPRPKTRAVLKHDGPDHLGLWHNALPDHQTALITSGLCATGDGLAAARPGPLDTGGDGRAGRQAGRARGGGAGRRQVPPWPTAAIPMDNPCCSCELTDPRGRPARRVRRR